MDGKQSTPQTNQHLHRFSNFPLEILIDTKRKDGVLKLSTLKRMERLNKSIEDIPELSSPTSVINAIKYAKQAYYNGNPNYYALPTAQENRFILSYFDRSGNDENVLNNYVDDTGQFARLTTFMTDIDTDRMEEIEQEIKREIAKIFPEERYTVKITGKALLFLKGTKYLIKNLVLSLVLAIFLIALFMAYLFRSFKMIIISLIPNLLPLIITAGMMGFLGIPLKPSTILVFSIAFGISDWGKYVLHFYRFVLWVFCLYELRIWWYCSFRRPHFNDLTFCHAGEFNSSSIFTHFVKRYGSE